MARAGLLVAKLLAAVIGSICLSGCNSGGEGGLFGSSAADKGGALREGSRLVATGDGKVAGDAGGDSGLGLDALDLVVVLDNVKLLFGLEVEDTSTGGSEVVSGRHYSG